MRRAGESRLKLWLLLAGNRMVVTAVALVAFVLGGVFLFPSFQVTATSTDIVDTIFATVTGALITRGTAVVAGGTPTPRSRCPGRLSRT